MQRFFTVLLLFPLFTFGQQQSQNISPVAGALSAITRADEQSNKLSTPKVSFSVSVNPLHDDIRNYLLASSEALQNPLSNLVLVSQKSSPVGKHFLYQQTFKGIPVYGAYIKVNLDKNDGLLSMVDHLIPSGSWGDMQVGTLAGKPLFIVGEQGLIPASNSFNQAFSEIRDPNGNLIKSLDTRFYFSQDDTLITGKVFNHDPLTTAGVIYGQGGTYQHFNDSDYALLNDQRQLVSFPATLDGDTFRLANEHAIILDINFPNTIPATSTTPTFDFTRSQSQFKEVMAFYHVTHTHDYIKSLGFDSLVQRQQKIDALSGIGDQSYFWPTDSTLNFGRGGIPDAEDADVITHEYTHAITYDIVGIPAENMTTERRSLEEGICDVMAGIQSYKTTTFNWRKLYNFDGTNPTASGVVGYWGGRNGESTKTYMNKTGNPYSDCEIWTSCMLDIAEAIGHDTLMTIMLTSVYSTTANTTMPEAAWLMIQTDSILYGKRHADTMGYFFNHRLFGTFPSGLNNINAITDGLQLANTLAFAEGKESAIILYKDNTPFDVTVYDMTGKKILSVQGMQNRFELSPSDFKTGFYIVKVSLKGASWTKKLARF